MQKNEKKLGKTEISPKIFKKVKKLTNLENWISAGARIENSFRTQ